MDVDIMDHGTPRVYDDDFGLTNSPTHTIFSPEPHSPTVTEVLPDTSRQSEESVGASSSASDAEPEARSAPTNFADDIDAAATTTADTDAAATTTADTDAAATTTADPKKDPPAAENEAEAEHNTNADPEAAPDRTEDRHFSSPLATATSPKAVPESHAEDHAS